VDAVSQDIQRSREESRIDKSEVSLAARRRIALAQLGG
jgi:hypothetical protein